MNAPQMFELHLTRFIRAPRERVFDAFTTPALLQQWHCPRGSQVQEASADAREGGQWQLQSRARDGSVFRMGGQYQQVQRPERLVYTWVWQGPPMPGVQTLVEVDFVARDDGTELRMRHSGFPVAPARDAHVQGWNSTLNRLVDLVDARGSAGTLTLLGDARSTYTRSVRMALAEKGLAYAHEPVGPHTPALLAVNPFGRIPALRDGELAIFETAAILQYLDEAFDGPSLTPGTIAGRVRSTQWLSAINAYLYDTMVRRYVLQFIFPRGADGRPDTGVIGTALAEMPAQLAALDAAYALCGAYLSGGDTPCHADLVLAPILAYVEHMPDGPRLLAECPALMRAQAAIRARPSFAATEPPRG